jgi:hypothetical protein
LRVVVEVPRLGLSQPAIIAETIEQTRATSVKTGSASSSEAAAGSPKSTGRRLKLSPAARRIIHHHLGLPRLPRK